MGSSSNSSSGLWASAPANATRCSSPPDSVSVRRSSSCAMPSASAASSTARATAAAGSPRCSSASAISARTPLITTCDSGSWKSVPHTRESSLGPCSRTDMPATVSSPDASPPWKCGTTPHAASSSVDLPLPDSPATTVNDPASSSSVELAERGPCGLRIAVGEVLGEQDRLRHAPPPAARPRRRTARPTTAAAPATSASSAGPASSAVVGYGREAARARRPCQPTASTTMATAATATRTSCRDHGRGTRAGRRAPA